MANKAEERKKKFEETFEKMESRYGKKEEEKKPASSPSKTTTTSSNTSVKEKKQAQRQQNFESTFAKMESRYNKSASVNETYINTFFEDAQSFLKRASSTVNGLDWKSATSGERYNSWNEEYTAMKEKEEKIRSYLRENKDTIDSSASKQITSLLDSFHWSSVDAKLAFNDAKKHYSQWETEEDYLKWKKDTEEYEALKNFDTKKGEAEVQDLEKVLNEYKSLSRTMITDRMQERLDYITANYGDEKGIKALIAEKKQYVNRAKHIQEGITLAGVINNDDFKENSGYTSTKKEGAWSRLTSDFGMGYDDLTYEYINGEESGMRQEIFHNAVKFDADTDRFAVYDHMTDDQISTYNYYYAKNGKEAAEKYLDSIREGLNYQAATAKYEKMEGKTALELLFGIEAGLDQFQSGMKNLFNTEDNYIAQSSTQMLSGMVREDLADNGAKLPDWLGGASLAQVGYDAITTTANMAPSIMTSAALNILAPGSGAVAGSLMMGASATGNAYQEMLNLGYDKDQARAYSTLVGASEAGLQYLLGGISSLGGKVSGNVLTKMMNGVDNAFLRTALQIGGNMLSEGLEEGLQEVLTPWFQNLIMHTDEDINWSEVAYSTLLGALTAGVMEGPTTIGDAVSIRNTGKQLQAADISATRLAEIGKTFSADTVAYQLAGKVDENTGAYTMGRLFNEIGATLSEQNVTEITEALVAKGMDQTTAKKNAQALAYVVEGGQLTDKQIAMIEANEVLADVARATLVDANTTWNQRTNALKTLADEMTAPKTAQAKAVQQSQENAPATDTVAGQNKEGAQTLSEAVDISPAKVQTISSIENGQVTVKLEDGTEINVKEADLYVDDGVRIETIAKLEGISATDANFILNTLRTNTSTTAQMDSLGAREAYKYGFYGFSQDHMTTHGVFANSLTETQRKAIYETGRAARRRQVDSKNATVKAKTQPSKEKSTGKVHFEGDRTTLTERQSASLTAMEKVADALGVQIYVFESEVNARGKRVGANGWYDPKDNSIHIDLHAGANGEGTMLFTAAHELTHFIRQWSPAKFKVLADFLMQEYGKKGVNVDALVREQMAKAKRNGRTISYDTAYEEVVADSMELMLADGKVMEKLAKLKAQDKDLWQKIKDFISELAAKIRAVYEGMSPDSVEGQRVAEMVDSIEKLQDLFAEGLVEASENYQSSLTPGEEGVVVSENGDPVAYSTEDGSVLLSMRTYDEEGRKAFRDYLNKCVSSNKLTKAEMQEMMDGIEDIYQTCKEFKDKYAPFSSWSDAAVVRDTYGKPVFSVVTPNGDYKMNLDFSLVCKKRRTLDAVFNEMSRRGIIDNFELGQKSVVKINEIIRRHGLETACALCFVDAKRFRQASMADQFTSLYNELVLSLVPEDQRSSIDHFNFSGYETIKKVENGIHKWDASKLDFSHLDEVMKNYGKGTVEHKAAKYIKSHAEGRRLLLRGDFMSSQGFDAVKTQNKDILKLYNSKKGTGGPKAAFGDVQYMNEIIKKARTWTPAKAYAVGGVRIQSFSDYVPRMVFDYVQMIYDLAATNLPAHAYTKEALFVKQFGLTGVKINMSLIPAIAEGGKAPGLDANDNYVWAGESFDYETAKEIQNAEGYTENCGTICVGVSDRHIRKLLSDPDIRMVIPYHKSGLNPIVAHMNKIAEFTDYTNKQNTTVKGTGAKADKHFDFNKALHDMGEKADPKAVIQQYFDWCDDNGYDPKFADFRDHPNYYKLIEDFTLYDKEGKYVPQREVRAVFPKEGSAFGSMKDLIKAGLEEDAIIEGKKESSLSSIVDEIQNTLPRTEAEIAEEQVEQADKDLEADVKLSDRDNAPTFYSHMAKVVDGVKQEKLGAASVVSMLRGKGVKAEEIKWSGIDAWLEGKKSVTKAELQEFIAGSMLQIEEETLDYKERPYTEDQKKRLAEYEAKRDEVVKRLVNEWKRITGEEFPVQNPGYDLESTVSRKIIEVNLERKNASFEGRLLAKLRKDFRKICEDNDDFGFDSWRDALRSLHRHRKDFINYYEMSANEKAVIVKFCNALDAYNELQNRISAEDTDRLRTIAREAEPWNRKIMEVNHEYNEEAAKYMPKWDGRRYNLEGGKNYREVLFRIPDSTYTNEAMFTHWENRSGILAHARIQDFDTFIGKMLFVEELQSDWHNEGHKTGYKDVPDAPFSDNYHEFVLKRLIRMAAEQDYDSIGWTTADIQSKRWSKEFAEGYRIEYDQDIPKFLNKYGKKWGTRVGKTVLDSGTEVWSMAITDSMKDSVLTEGQPLYSMRDTAERAKEYFGTTTDFEEAGFILPSGEMLKFTDDKHRGERQYDHRAIGIAYGVNVDLNVNHGFNTESNKHLDDFVEKGGIRFDPGSFDLDMDAGMQLSKSIPLTTAQEQTIREFIAWKQQREEIYKHGDDAFSLYGGPLALHIEFGADANYAVSVSAKDLDAWGVKHLSYEGGQINADRIIADIRHYYKTGETRKASLVAQFRYSDRDSESVSNRSLLANAFEGVAQNDMERQKIQDYKGKIALINAEERKLQDLNQQIKDLSFAKGPKDTKAIRDLQFQAKQTANRISTYDKQLLALEASKPLQNVLTREKKMAYQRAEKKGKEALEAYREKTMKTQRELIEKWQDSRKKGVENREKTAMRHKIQNVVGELNNLLLTDDKKRHVPDNLKKAVADALDLVNMDTVGAEERAAKYAALIAKETDPDKIDAYTATMENILRQGEKMGKRLKDLHEAYEEIQNSDDPDIANAYDPVIAGAIKELSQTIGKTSLRNMTLDQLSDVYDVYRMVLTRVRDANKTLLDNIKESISNLASRTIGEVRMAGGEHKTRATILDPVKKFMWNNMKPVYAMEYIGSSTLTKVFNNVRSGEDVWAKDVTEAREYYLDKAKKYGYNSWDFKKKYRFQSASDLEFELTLEQILSLYAYSKREQAHDHLRLGGFVFDSNIETYKDKGSKLIKYKVNTADAHQISPEILANIIGTLTSDQMGFVDEMQEYLSAVMGAKGNEVTFKMYGVKLFKEKFYFPLKSAKQFMFEQNEVAGEVKIKNSGFTNKVVAKANNPVILSNFMEVWSGHVNDMSMYHAFTLPLEDFNRVFNYNSPKKENQPSVSVKGTIQNAYSPAAVHYVKQLITDLNGGARSDSTTGFINKMMGLFKKGSVFASLSVVVQQPSAIARAAALVDTKYFIGPKVDHKKHKVLWDEVKQYAPVAIIKEMGYFDTNMGKSTQDFILSKEYSGFTEKMKALFTDSGFRDEALSKAPALADEIAWCSIWEAVKRETKAKYPGLDVKAEPFLKLCGSRFTEVITKTQVYDSVLSRSGLMRSKDTGMKMATAFMAEPTTSINMITDALLKGKRGNKKYARGAIGAVIASQILNSILVSFVYAGRDDDEDETYVEKYIGTLTGQTLDSLNPAGYLPFIKDIMSIVRGYDVERSDMAVISDLWKAIENLKKDNMSPYRKVEGFVGSIAQIFGLPVKNLMRDARGIYQTIDSFVNGQQTTKAGIGYAVKGAITGKTVSNDQQLYEAILSGDQTQIARVKGRFEDQSAINSAIRKALRANDSRIHDAAVAWNANDLDEYMRIAKEIIGEKYFSQDDVVMAIRAEANKLAPSDGTTGTSSAKGLFTAEKFAEAIAQGDQATANAIKSDILQTAQKNGKTAAEAEKSFESTAKGDLKELYLAGTLSEAKAINALSTYCGETRAEAEQRVAEWKFEDQHGFKYDDKKQQFMDGNISASELKNLFMQVEGKTDEEANSNIVNYTRDAYEEGFFDRAYAASVMVDYGGLTEGEAESKLQYIDVKKALPDTYVDDAWVAEYYKEVESSGISIEVFVDYRNQVKSITGEGKKERRMRVIDSMPISNAQKDALYYAEGWAASRLYEAPWR